MPRVIAMVDLPLNGAGCRSRLRQLSISENIVEWSEGRAPARWRGLPGVMHAMCDVSDGLVADLAHICEGSGVSAVIEVTARPLAPPVRCIVAEDPDLVPLLAGAGDDCELVFTSPSDAGPSIEYLSPELALPITATGAIEAKAGVRLVDAACQQVPITASGLPHFRC